MKYPEPMVTISLEEYTELKKKVNQNEIEAIKREMPLMLRTFSEFMTTPSHALSEHHNKVDSFIQYWNQNKERLMRRE